MGTIQTIAATKNPSLPSDSSELSSQISTFITGTETKYETQPLSQAFSSFADIDLDTISGLGTFGALPALPTSISGKDGGVEDGVSSMSTTVSSPSTTFENMATTSLKQTHPASTPVFCLPPSLNRENKPEFVPDPNNQSSSIPSAEIPACFDVTWQIKVGAGVGVGLGMLGFGIAVLWKLRRRWRIFEDEKRDLKLEDLAVQEEAVMSVGRGEGGVESEREEAESVRRDEIGSPSRGQGQRIRTTNVDGPQIGGERIL
jgi:hypothetical protein